MCYLEKSEASYTVDMNVNCYNHYGEQYGGSLKNSKWNYYMIQQSHSWYMCPNVHSSTIYNSQDMKAT